MLALTLVDVAATAPLAFLLGIFVGLLLARRYSLARRNGVNSRDGERLG